MIEKTFRVPAVAAPSSAPQPPPDRWTPELVRTSLQNGHFADWAAEWLLGIEREGGPRLDELLQSGFGGSNKIPAWMSPGAPRARWLLQYFQQHPGARADWFREGFLADDPPWLAQLLRQEQAGVARSFLLNGNVNDYAFDPVRGYRPSIRVLVDALRQYKDCVLSYRLAQGLVLHTTEIHNHLPSNIQRYLNTPAMVPDNSLSTRLCLLFDDLRRWMSELTETQGTHAFGRGVAIIFENVHLLIPPNRGDIDRNFLVDNLLLWSISPELFRSSNCLILQAEALEDVGAELRSRGGKIEQIELRRPETVSERFKFLRPLLDSDSGMADTRVARLPRGHDWLWSYDKGAYSERLRRLSKDTAGLTLIGIEDLLQEASAGKDLSLNRKEVMRLKGQHLRQESQGLIEVLEPRRNLTSIGGYGPLKERLREVVDAWRNSQDELALKTIPMGILFFGPPGTGKSIVAEAFAGEAEVSLAKLGDFRGKYVGDSERNLSRILSLLEALHPVIVFVDEIDQAMGKRGGPSGDGGVDNRIFGRLLEFMSDTAHRGKILWIGASNFPERIDPAMKRPGRFDLILPFFLPDENSRADILEISLKDVLGKTDRIATTLTPADYQELARRTSGLSGAELSLVANEVLRRASVRNRSETKIVLDRALFETVLAVYTPPAGVRERYAEMEQLARAETGFSDLLPSQYRPTSESMGHGNN